MDLLDPFVATVAALLLFRIGALMLTAPMFSAHTLTMRIRAAVGLLLVVAALPTAVAAAEPGVRFDLASAAAEAVVGAVMGLAAGILVAGAESAGDTLAVQMGLSGANVLDPHSRTQMPVLGQLLGLAVLAFFLAVDGHLVVIRTMARSLEALPPGGVPSLEGGIGTVLRLGGRVFVLGLGFAAPVVAAMMLGNVVMGVMARAVPQLNVLLVAFPLQIGIGLLTLGASMSLVAAGAADFTGGYAAFASELLEGLVSGDGGT